MNVLRRLWRPAFSGRTYSPCSSIALTDADCSPTIRREPTSQATRHTHLVRPIPDPGWLAGRVSQVGH